MKNNYFKLVLTCLFCGCATIISATNLVNDIEPKEAEAAVVDTGETVDHERMFQTQYFSNLRDNYGVNYNGTCGYLAAAMLVSYYDTYWNDEFVDDKYIEKGKLPSNNMDLSISSPGYKREPSEMYMQLNASKYINYVKQYKDEYLHAFMINLGLENKLVVKNKFGLSFDDTYKLMNLYMQTRTELGNRDYEIQKIEVAEGSRWIKYLSQGIPVLLTMHSADLKKSHCAIAYDYDPDTEEIFCHMGYGKELTHVTPESQGYAYYTEGVILKTLSAHRHTDNYEYNSADQREHKCHCSCEAKFVNDISITQLMVSKISGKSHGIKFKSASTDPNFSYFPLTIDFLTGKEIIYTKQVTPLVEYSCLVPREVVNIVGSNKNKYNEFKVRVSSTVTISKTSSYKISFTKTFPNSVLTTFAMRVY